MIKFIYLDFGLAYLLLELFENYLKIKYSKKIFQIKVQLNHLSVNYFSNLIELLTYPLIQQILKKYFY